MTPRHPPALPSAQSLYRFIRGRCLLPQLLLRLVVPAHHLHQNVLLALMRRCQSGRGTGGRRGNGSVQEKAQGTMNTATHQDITVKNTEISLLKLF